MWIHALLPLIVALLFIALFLWKASSPKPPILDWSLQSPVRFAHFSYGKIAFYDNNQELSPHDGPPWVFIHSIGSSMYSWRYQLDAFWSQQRVIAFDLLGFGKSDKPSKEDYSLDATSARILQLLDERQIQKCHLIGCSLGGALALWLKYKHPERFLKIVAIAPAATPSVVPFLKIPHDKLALLAKKIVSRPLIKAALHGGLAYRERISAEVVHNYFIPFLNPEAVTCFLKTVSIIKDSRLFAALPQIQPSLLILWGERDRVIPRWALQKILQQLPQAEVKTHPGGGHHLMEDEPEWTNAALSDFLSPSIKTPLDSAP